MFGKRRPLSPTTVKQGGRKKVMKRGTVVALPPVYGKRRKRSS